MKRIYLIIICTLLISSFLLTSCGKKKTNKKIELMSNEERLSLFKSLNRNQLLSYLKKLKPKAKEKAGFQMLKEGKRFFQQSDYQKAYDYLIYANLLLPFKAENNYIMARICSKLNKNEQAMIFLQKAIKVDAAYARRSADEDDFTNLRDSNQWRGMVYKISENTLLGKWKGHRENIILKLFPNKTWKYYKIENSIVSDEKSGSWRYEKVKLPNNKTQHRITLWGELNGVYVIQVESIEGFTMYKLNKWLSGNRFFPDFKKKNFAKRKKLFNR